MANLDKTQKLNQDYQIILQQIAEYKRVLKAGKKVINLINKYSATYEKLDKKLLAKTNEFRVSLNSITEVKGQIEGLQSSAQQTLSQIEQPLADLKIKTEALNVLHEEANQIKDRISGKESEAQTILNTVTELRDNITNLNTSATQLLEQINNTLAGVQGKIAELNTVYDTFLQIKQAIENPDTGLQAILATSNSVQKEILAIKEQGNTLFTEISRIKDDSNNFLKDITTLKQNAQTEAYKIKEYEKQSQENKLKIAQIYKLATDSSLANSFDKRKKELYIGVYIWAAVLILAIMVLVIMLIWIHNGVFKNNNQTISSIFWYRLTMTFPLLFLVGFSAQQYGKERGLLEKYAFKSANAFALESYTTLLTSKFNKFQERILEFVIQSMTIIYKEPYENTKESKIVLAIGNKLAELRTELSEKIEETVAETKEAVGRTVEKIVEKAPKKQAA